MDLRCGIRELFCLFSLTSFTAQRPRQRKAGTPQRCKREEMGRSTLNSNPFAMGKRGCERKGWSPPAQQIPKSNALAISASTSHITSSTLPARSASLVPVGREESGLLICTVCRRIGSQSWLRTQKRCHNANSSHQLYNASRVLGQGHSAFMSLLSWEGGEKQHFSACRGDRREERLLHFQACFSGETTSAQTLGKSPQQSFPLLKPAASSRGSSTNHSSLAPQTGSPHEDTHGQCTSLGLL